MRRNAPLKRNVALQTKSRRDRPGATLKRSPAPTRTAQLKARPKRRRTQAEADASERWYRIVVSSGVCVACGKPGGHLEGAHVVRQQTLRRLEDERGLERGTLLWDPELGIPLHGRFSDSRCHSKHDFAVERIPRHKLPKDAIAAALALGPDGERALQEFPEVDR